MSHVLVCDPDESWHSKMETVLTEEGHTMMFASNGKIAQGHIAKNEFDALVINMDTRDFTALEVIKFLKFRSMKTKIFLIFNTQQMLDELQQGLKGLAKLGVSEVMVKPFPIQALMRMLSGMFQHSEWRKIEGQKSEEIEIEVKELDTHFTSVKVEDFYGGNVAIFNLYIRLGKNKYLQILNSGDFLEDKRLKKYQKEKGVDKLYFKTRDRLAYIDFLNDSINKFVNHRKKIGVKEAKVVEGVSKKFVEEFYTKGLSPEVIDQGTMICQHIHATIGRNPELDKLLRKYISDDNSEEGHIFLTAFYTSIICENLKWVTAHSRDTIMFGAFLHDLGKIKLAQHIRKKPVEEMSADEYIEYKKHPQYGVELLEGTKGIREQVLQIIYQHHELNNGTGFPSALTASKIYPLAKIVGFADFMSKITQENHLTPYEAMRKLVEDRTDIFLYDTEVIKAFIKGFIHDLK